MTAATKEGTNWAALLSPATIERWGLPASASLDNQGEARGVAMRWSTLQREFRSQRPPPANGDALWYVACDVLILDEDINAPDGLLLVARHVEVEGERTISIASTVTATIVCQSIGPAGSLRVRFGEVSAALRATPGQPATVLVLDGPSASVTPEAWSPREPGFARDNIALVEDGALVYRCLVTQFQIATLLADEKPQLAVHILRWVAEMAGISPASQLLAGQARTMLIWALDRVAGRVRVPPLDFTVYAKAAKGQLEVFQGRAAAYDKWVGLERSDADWLRQARLTVALQSNERHLASELRDRAAQTVERTEAAKAQAGEQLLLLSQAVDHAKTNFDAGVKVWRRHNEISKGINIAVNIVKFGVSVAKLVAMVAAPGAGEAVGGAGVAGADVVAGAGEALTVAPTSSRAVSGQLSKVSKLSKVSDVAGSMDEANTAAGNVVKSVSELIDVGRTADKLDRMASNTLAMTKENVDQTLSNAPLAGLDSVTGGRQRWRNLSASLDSIFRTNTELDDIVGGPQFRLALRRLVLGAEAYCATRLEVAHDRSVLAEAELRSRAAQRALTLASRSAKVFASDLAKDEHMRQEAFGRLLDAKRVVYLELERYQHAIRYFTLGDPPLLPRVTDRVIDFRRQSAEIGGYKLALDMLQPIPEKLERTSVTVPVSAKPGGPIMVQIDEDQTVFASMARVRADSVLVRLLDAAGQAISLRRLSIASSGVYRDRTPAGTSVEFVGPSWQRSMSWDGDGKLTMTGETYERYGQLVFKPTPFTTWTIVAEARNNTSVASIELSFVGEVSPLVS